MGYAIKDKGRQGADQFLRDYLGNNLNISMLTWDHWVECLKDYKSMIEPPYEITGFTYILNPQTAGKFDFRFQMPIALNCGSQFEHESGRYKVVSIVQHIGFKDHLFLCEFIDNTNHLTNQLRKGKEFSYSNPVNN